MPDREIETSRFKERCLALLEDVARTLKSIVITKRGKPVAQVVPLEASEKRPLKGSVTILTDDERELFSTGEVWEAEDLPDAE